MVRVPNLVIEFEGTGRLKVPASNGPPLIPVETQLTLTYTYTYIYTRIYMYIDIHMFIYVCIYIYVCRIVL